MGPVAVVYVPVDDRDTTEPAGARVGRGDRDVVQQTEPHPALRAGVVSGRSHQGDPHLAAGRGVEQRVYERDGPSGGAVRGREGPRPQVRVVIEGGEQALVPLEVLHVRAVVYAGDFIGGHVARGERVDRDASPAQRLEGVPRGQQPLGALGVIAAGPVLVEEGIVDDEETRTARRSHLSTTLAPPAPRHQADAPHQARQANCGRTRPGDNVAALTTRTGGHRGCD